ncbi:hypothetical protein COU20_02790 [Candidatus Kaiserbacteria bacterium CG10_big_fil_rev_8_21_14_0_10_59_10]|uniref:Metallo-beta-lactamase domain-containing protein n=1 Tax=Candidatus Kaiserbacteria bacterium CG10_big_fil_rev_8_21_14_0_10_59_10 TaxID=1974612 RepID=A0A2H0U7E0_9BACT|nr:MAG: hypothetical protein COU20_02790 [Candidatus Kaiserbacteria bacterium CG10_big_fil_rev_8_21_14_0_10_59_10]
MSTGSTQKRGGIPRDGSELPLGAFGTKRTILQLGLITLVGLALYTVASLGLSQGSESALYFLDVGQGDSQLITLSAPEGNSAVHILVDAGSGRRVLDALEAVLQEQRARGAYIDMLILTHPDLDHFGGFIDIVERYDIGIFVSNGHTDDSPAFDALETALAERGVPRVTLSQGDSIRYGEHTLTLLAPNEDLLRHENRNEASIVFMLEAHDTRVLFAGDIGFPAEEALLKDGFELAAHVLKVPHHGSRFSTGESFAAAVRPVISVIGVGQNRYGHPAPRVLETLELAGSRVYRTDIDGTVKVPLGAGGAPPARAERSGMLASAANILTGAYKKPRLTLARLEDAAAEAREFRLVPVTRCSFKTAVRPSRTPVVFNEIAWMGAPSGATHEWVELRNVRGAPVDVSGWQVINENERIHLTLPQQARIEGEFMLLARSAATDALGLEADALFSGSIRNRNEGLRLFDNECTLIDEVHAAPHWPAGNNATKQTMERTDELLWTTSRATGGTPRR